MGTSSNSRDDGLKTNDEIGTNDDDTMATTTRCPSPHDDDGFRDRAAAPRVLALTNHCTFRWAFVSSWRKVCSKTWTVCLQLKNTIKSKKETGPLRAVEQAPNPNKRIKRDQGWEDVVLPGDPAWSVGYDFSSRALGATETLYPGSLNSKFRQWKSKFKNLKKRLLEIQKLDYLAKLPT